MNRKLKLTAISLGLAALLALSFAGITMADDPAGEGDIPSDCCNHDRGPRHGLIVANHGVVSELLGLTREEIHDLRLDGKSLVEIAAAQGVSEDELVTAIITARQEIIQQRVTDGKITQEQADRILGVMEQNIQTMINRTASGPPEGRGNGCYGPGRGFRMPGRHCPLR